MQMHAYAISMPNLILSKLSHQGISLIGDENGFVIQGHQEGAGTQSESDEERGASLVKEHLDEARLDVGHPKKEFDERILFEADASVSER